MSQCDQVAKGNYRNLVNFTTCWSFWPKGVFSLAWAAMNSEKKRFEEKNNLCIPIFLFCFVLINIGIQYHWLRNTFYELASINYSKSESWLAVICFYLCVICLSFRGSSSVSTYYVKQVFLSPFFSYFLLLLWKVWFLLHSLLSCVDTVLATHSSLLHCPKCVSWLLSRAFRRLDTKHTVTTHSSFFFFMCF